MLTFWILDVMTLIQLSLLFLFYSSSNSDQQLHENFATSSSALENESKEKTSLDISLSTFTVSVVLLCQTVLCLTVFLIRNLWKTTTPNMLALTFYSLVSSISLYYINDYQKEDFRLEKDLAQSSLDHENLQKITIALIINQEAVGKRDDQHYQSPSRLHNNTRWEDALASPCYSPSEHRNSSEKDSKTEIAFQRYAAAGVLLLMETGTGCRGSERARDRGPEGVRGEAVTTAVVPTTGQSLQPLANNTRRGTRLLNPFSMFKLAIFNFCTIVEGLTKEALRDRHRVGTSENNQPSSEAMLTSPAPSGIHFPAIAFL
ncbi:unnamed protein product [Caenorhabditis auriculariae]|uniref:Uncharacterized protein n=1 Tax=Caenorhabditis auriculariae TaxID=2777116 RepID=A0A8S1GTY6_9PELO|nr:unnamed protein product [Caenorhabditis auriculariae]